MNSDEIVVLTGAAGCIGFHTLKLLIEHDKNVREIRCLDIREPENDMKRQIESIITNIKSFNKTNNKNQYEAPNIVWFKGDIRDINLVENIISGTNCIIHCAARIEAWTQASEQKVNELHSVNVIGTETLLEAAKTLGVEKFIHVSSFESYVGYDTIYYATENTIPDTKWFLFGASGSTKKEAEDRVRQYSNVKLENAVVEGRDKLLTVIIRFSTVYGEFDRHYLTRIIEAARFFNGRLIRMSNVWIRQQSVYATNAAWSLIQAKKRLDHDKSISGEEFHITDDTAIEDPFDFVDPFLRAKGMRVTRGSYPFIPVWILLWFVFAFARLIKRLDVLGLFVRQKSRYQETLERDKQVSTPIRPKDPDSKNTKSTKRWYYYVTPQTLYYMCNSSFLNRTKASLRLDYEPLVDPDESKKRALEWYRNAKI